MKRITVGQLNRDAELVRGRVNIEGIHLSSLKLSSDIPRQSGPFSIDTAANVHTELNGSLIEIRVQHDVEASSVKATSSKSKPAWQVSVEITGLYRVDDENAVELTENQAHAYAIAFGINDLYPYTREAVQNSVARTGYPPFLMPLDFLTLPSDDNAEIDFMEDE